MPELTRTLDVNDFMTRVMKDNDSIDAMKTVPFRLTHLRCKLCLEWNLVKPI